MTSNQPAYFRCRSNNNSIGLTSNFEHCVTLTLFQLVLLKAAQHFGVGQPLSMIRERYAFYSGTFPSPLGNVSNCFFVSDTADPPRVDGVLIPEADYDARAVIELDFSVCTPHIATSIICKFKSYDHEKYTIIVNLIFRI